MNDNIHLNYYGASGGFFALWILLFGTSYRCKFSDNGINNDLDLIFHNHWNINNCDDWKKTEIYPNDDETLNSNIEKKVFFHCNPSSNTFNTQSGYRIILYTDLDTQYKLSFLKKAFYFFKNRHGNIDAPFIRSYNNIKDPSWPDINNINQFDQLPKHIQNEFFKMTNIESTTNYIDSIFPTILYNGEKVTHLLHDIINKADLVVKLQDIIKTDGNAILKPLGYNSNNKVKEFIQFWLNLHPENIRNMLVNP